MTVGQPYAHHWGFPQLGAPNHQTQHSQSILFYTTILLYLSISFFIYIYLYILYTYLYLYILYMYLFLLPFYFILYPRIRIHFVVEFEKLRRSCRAFKGSPPLRMRSKRSITCWLITRVDQLVPCLNPCLALLLFFGISFACLAFGQTLGRLWARLWVQTLGPAGDCMASLCQR